MPCFFCSSSNHLSENCDTYVSHESRKERARSKKCCETCLSSSHIHPSSICYLNKKCYKCFSRDHHTAFCRNIAPASKFFVPKLDGVVLTRFTRMLSPIEQVHMATSSPSVSDLVKIKPMNIYQRIWCSSYRENQKAYGFLPEPDTFCATNILEFSKLAPPPADLRKWLSEYKNVICASSISLDTCQFTSGEFLMLLSAHTKELRCRDVKIEPPLNFSDMLKRLPNITNLKLYSSSIVFDSRWFEEWLKRNNSSYLKHVRIDTDEFAFDGEFNCNKIMEKFRNDSN